MLNSSESANSVARRYNVPSHELRFDLRDHSRATYEKIEEPPAVMPAMTRGDRQNTASPVVDVHVFHGGFRFIWRFIRRFAARGRKVSRGIISNGSNSSAARGDFFARAAQVHCYPFLRIPR
jgi:hypothetical protein